MKTGNVVLIAVLFLIIGILVASWIIKYNNVCYDLPEHGSTSEWGPKYWKAIHDIANRIPCSLCREDGKSLFVFAHDLVNIKTEKPIRDEKNFSDWLNKISDIKVQRDRANVR